MIVKIIYTKHQAKQGSFPAVIYNTGKIEKNKGELMRAKNFGSLDGLGNRRPQDYINYFKTLSATNRNIKDPQFHAVISAKGIAYNKQSLTRIAGDWLKEMGYGEQPQLLIFHKDTANNHIHMVSARVDRNGNKINSAFEKRRAISNLNKVLGYEFGFQYKFSTKAQFLTLLEQHGYPGIDPDEKKIQQKIDEYTLDKVRAVEIKNLLQRIRDQPGFIEKMRTEFNIDLVFHAADGKRPYGYTIIDNKEKTVYKGSEVWSLKQLIGANLHLPVIGNLKNNAVEAFEPPAHIQSVWIADDVDDQQIHGIRRRRQKKERTNSR